MGQLAVNKLLGDHCGFGNNNNLKNESKKKKVEEEENINELSASKVNSKNTDLIYS